MVLTSGISVGTAVEHFALYQYQFADTRNIFAGQIQTETAYVIFPYLRKR